MSTKDLALIAEAEIKTTASRAAFGLPGLPGRHLHFLER